MALWPQLLTLLAVADSAPSPKFLVTMPGELRSCSSQVPFAGWCGHGVLDKANGYDKGWVADLADTNPWMSLELGAPYLLSGLAMQRCGPDMGQRSGTTVKSYKVSVRSDKDDPWIEVGIFQGPTAADSVEAKIDAIFEAPIRARYVNLSNLMPDEVNGRPIHTGFRVGWYLTTDTPRTEFGSEIPYLGCFKKEPNLNNGGVPVHTPATCNTACLGFKIFSLFDSGYCHCRQAGSEGLQEENTCNHRHRFDKGLNVGCSQNRFANFLCGGDAMMTYSVVSPPAGTEDAARAVAEIRSTPFLASVSRENPSWPVRCITEADVRDVRERCLLDKKNGQDRARGLEQVCAAKFCAKVIPRPDRSDNVKIYPARREDCYQAPCRRYRFQWCFSVGDGTQGEPEVSEHIARLVKFTGKRLPGGTPWFIIPDLTIWHSVNIEQEMREADMWLPDLGEVTNITMYFDVEGEFSVYKQFTYTFTPHVLRLASVDDDDPYYYEVGFSGAFGPMDNHYIEADQHHWYKNFVNPRFVAKRYKFYDIIRTSTRCQEADRGGCPWMSSSDLSEYGGYAKSVPSWIELRQLTLGNAWRTNPMQAGIRYFGLTEEEIREKVIGKCEMPEELVITEGMRPKYTHVDSIEMNRLKSWACADPNQGCSHAMPGAEHLNRVGAPTDREFWFLDEPSVWPGRNSGWENSALVGGYASSVEQLGGVPFINSCGHMGGFMNPMRPMDSIAFFPSSAWNPDDLLNMEGYTGQVCLQLGSASVRGTAGDSGWDRSVQGNEIGDYAMWATQPWSNAWLNTYQPIPTGVHVASAPGAEWPHFGGAVAKRDTWLLRFVAQYYDTSDTPPDAFEVLVDGEAKPMKLVAGKAYRGTYEYEDVDFGRSKDAPCRSYVFRATNKYGKFFLPQSGRIVFRTYGIGRCKELWKEQSCTETSKCRASCGFPGHPCGLQTTPDDQGGHGQMDGGGEDSDDSHTQGDGGNVKPSKNGNNGEAGNDKPDSTDMSLGGPSMTSLRIGSSVLAAPLLIVVFRRSLCM